MVFGRRNVKKPSGFIQLFENRPFRGRTPKLRDKGSQNEILFEPEFWKHLQRPKKHTEQDPPKNNRYTTFRVFLSRPLAVYLNFDHFGGSKRGSFWRPKWENHYFGRSPNAKTLKKTNVTPTSPPKNYCNSLVAPLGGDPGAEHLVFWPSRFGPFFGTPFLSTFGILERLGRLLKHFWPHFGDTFLKRPIFKNMRKSSGISHFFHSQPDHFFFAFSTHFWSRRRVTSKARFLAFSSLFGPLFGARKTLKMQKCFPNRL